MNPKIKQRAEQPILKPKAALATTKADKAKLSDPKPNAAEKVQSFIKMMNSSVKYRGKVQVKSAKDYRTPYDLRRPTGILELDLALGGGFPAGGASQVVGARSSGKTHICFCVAGQIQKHYGNNAVIMIALSEMRADVGFARMSGLCVEYSEYEIDTYEKIRLDEGKPAFTPEEKADLRHHIGHVTFMTGATGGDVLDTTLVALDSMGSDCQLMIVDSLGSLLTPAQDEKSVSDKHYGGSSGLLTLWQTKMQPMFVNDREDGSMLETTVIGINQVRALIGGPVPNATRPAAGSKSWEHAQLTNVEFKQGDILWADSKHTEQSGKVVRWSIKKGKAGTHDGAKGEFNWYHFPHHDPVFWKDVVRQNVSFGADKITDLVEVAKKMGIIEMGGPWRTVKDTTGKVLVRTQGDELLVERVANDPEIESMLRDACLKASNLTVRYC